MAATEQTDQNNSIDWQYHHVEDIGPIEHALQYSNWEKGQGDASFSYDGRYVWLRYQLPTADEPRVFQIENPWLRKIDVYLVANGTVISQYKTGAGRPFDTRPMGSNGFAFPINRLVTDVYIFDHAETASNFPISLVDSTTFNHKDAQLTVLLGLYYGMLIMIIGYGFAVFLGTRSPAYFNYACYGASLLVFLSIADGSAAQFIWPQNPDLNHLALPVVWAMALIFMAEFCFRFLEFEGRTLRYLKNTGQATIVATAVSIMISGHVVTLWLQTVVSGVYLIGIFSLGILALLQKHRNAPIFIAANGVFTLSASLHIAMLMSWISPSLWIQHSMHFGSVGELIILSIGLVRHVRSLERERFAAFETSEKLIRRNQELSAAKALAEEHRELQKSIQQAQKLKTIGQLAGGFAHDFNNILASILGFAELAKDRISAGDKATLLRYVSEIESSGQRGANLVKQLLVYSRSTSFEPKNIDMSKALQAAHNLLRGSLPATVSIDTHLPKRTVSLQIDPEQLQQVLVNICINAAEAMQNRGSIDIYLEQMDLEEMHCTSCSSRFGGEHVVIKVEDTGPGIKGSAEELFTPFHTTKDVGQGSGLGLSVVHGIVHEHGGHIHASNQAQRGARMAIYLPTENVEADITAADNAKRVLVIEDDASLASYLTNLLGSKHIATDVVTQPTEALEMFVANPQFYDLVVTDYLMPQATGIELTKEIHALRPDLPVILTTGNANNLDQAEVQQAKFAGIFEKPLNSELLVAKILGLLAR